MDFRICAEYQYNMNVFVHSSTGIDGYFVLYQLSTGRRVLEVIHTSRGMISTKFNNGKVWMKNKQGDVIFERSSQNFFPSVVESF